MNNSALDDLINMALALVVFGLIVSGVYYGPREINKWVKKETVTRVKKGIFSLERYSEKLTGKKLDF